MAESKKFDNVVAKLAKSSVHFIAISPDDVTDVPVSVGPEFWCSLLTENSIARSEKQARLGFMLRALSFNGADVTRASISPVAEMSNVEVVAVFLSVAYYNIRQLLDDFIRGEEDPEDLSNEATKLFRGTCVVVRELPHKEKAQVLCSMDMFFKSRKLVFQAVRIVDPTTDEEAILALPVHLQVMAISAYPDVFYHNKSLTALHSALEAAEIARQQLTEDDVQRKTRGGAAALKSDDDDDDDDSDSSSSKNDNKATSSCTRKRPADDSAGSAPKRR